MAEEACEKGPKARRVVPDSDEETEFDSGPTPAAAPPTVDEMTVDGAAANATEAKKAATSPAKAPAKAAAKAGFFFAPKPAKSPAKAAPAAKLAAKAKSSAGVAAAADIPESSSSSAAVSEQPALAVGKPV